MGQVVARYPTATAKLLGAGSAHFVTAQGMNFSFSPSVYPVLNSALLSFLRKQGEGIFGE